MAEIPAWNNWNGALAQLARAFDWQSRGQGFDSPRLHRYFEKVRLEHLFCFDPAALCSLLRAPLNLPKNPLYLTRTQSNIQMNNLQAYDAKIYHSLREMIRHAQYLMTEGEMEEVFELVRRFDESLVDEAYIILQKDWRQLEKNQLKGTLYGNEYRIENSRIMDRFLAILGELERKYAVSDRSHRIHINYSEGIDLRQWLDDARPLKNMEWLRGWSTALKTLSLVLIRDPEGAPEALGGMIWRGGRLLIPAASKRYGGVMSEPEVKLLGDEGYAGRVFRPVRDKGHGDSDLGYTVFALNAPKDLRELPLSAGRIKSGESGWFFCPQQSEQPRCEMYIADCRQVQGGWLIFEGENLSPAAGALVLNRRQEIVGFYLGNRDADGRYRVLSIHELSETLEQTETTPGESAGLIRRQAVGPTIGEHHQYSCNRTVQNDDFAITALTHPEKDRERVHFFLMYGCDLQQHEGLFHWFAARLAGKDSDHLRQSQTQYIRVISKVLSFPASQKIEALKLKMVSDFLSIFNIPPSKIERLREKNLAFALEHSRQLKDLRAGIRIAVLFIISEKRWNPQIFQPAIRWFVEDFCHIDLPALAPQFFFFFAVEYDEDRTDIPEQIQRVMKDPEMPVNPLAELEMVKEIDVEDWFDTYRRFWKKTRDRKRTFRKYFQQPFQEEGELYMEDVQDYLREIINEINDSQKDGNRHS